MLGMTKVIDNINQGSPIPQATHLLALSRIDSFEDDDFLMGSFEHLFPNVSANGNSYYLPERSEDVRKSSVSSLKIPKKLEAYPNTIGSDSYLRSLEDNFFPYNSTSAFCPSDVSRHFVQTIRHDQNIPASQGQNSYFGVEDNVAGSVFHKTYMNLEEINERKLVATPDNLPRKLRKQPSSDNSSDTYVFAANTNDPLVGTTETVKHIDNIKQSPLKVSNKPVSSLNMHRSYSSYDIHSSHTGVGMFGERLDSECIPFPLDNPQVNNGFAAQKKLPFLPNYLNRKSKSRSMEIFLETTSPVWPEDINHTYSNEVQKNVPLFNQNHTNQRQPFVSSHPDFLSKLPVTERVDNLINNNNTPHCSQPLQNNSENEYFGFNSLQNAVNIEAGIDDLDFDINIFNSDIDSALSGDHDNYNINSSQVTRKRQKSFDHQTNNIILHKASSFHASGGLSAKSLNSPLTPFGLLSSSIPNTVKQSVKGIKKAITRARLKKSASTYNEKLNPGISASDEDMSFQQARLALNKQVILSNDEGSSLKHEHVVVHEVPSAIELQQSVRTDGNESAMSLIQSPQTSSSSITTATTPSFIENSTNKKKHPKTKQKQRRVKWSETDLLILWGSIYKFGNEWREVQKNLPRRTYHQVKDKGRRLLQRESWQTGKSKKDSDDAKEIAKDIAAQVLRRIKGLSDNEALVMDLDDLIRKRDAGEEITSLIVDKKMISDDVSSGVPCQGDSHLSMFQEDNNFDVLEDSNYQF